MNRLGVMTLCCLSLCGCKMFARRDAYAAPRPVKDFKAATAAVTREDRANYAAVNRFAVRLLQAMDFGASGQDEAVSPVGTFMALSLLLNGAQSETFEALCKVLGLDDPNLERLNTSNGHLLDLLESQPTRASTISQSLWSVAPVKFSPRYVDDMAKWYSADVRRLGSAGENAYKQIRDWTIAKGGGGSVAEFKQLSKDDDCFVLASVVSLDLTLSDAVADAAAQTITVHETKTKVITTDVATVTQLSTTNPGVTVWIAVPRDNLTVTNVVDSLRADTPQAWASAPSDHNVTMTLKVPRANHSPEFEGALDRLGGQTLTKATSDFTSMGHETKTGFWVSRVQQFCSAQSIIPSVPTSHSTGAKPVVVNKPYLLVVTESVSGTILLAAVRS